MTSQPTQQGLDTILEIATLMAKDDCQAQNVAKRLGQIQSGGEPNETGRPAELVPVRLLPGSAGGPCCRSDRCVGPGQSGLGLLPSTGWDAPAPAGWPDRVPPAKRARR